MPTIADIFHQAVQSHRGGNLAQAEVLYRQVLQANPSHADSLHFLGMIAHQTGHPQAAISLIRRAVAVNPNDANAQINLGNALKDQGQPGEAVACYRQALQINPNHALAHYNLGNALMDQDEPDQAMACFRQALQLNPNHVDAHNNLGTLLKEQEQLAEADACFRQALRINPNSANALCNLGNVLKDQGKLDEAADCYRQALRIDPGHKPTLWNRCLLHLLQGDFPAAWPDFELRFARPGMAPRACPQPLWDGSSLEGKTILVDAELGLGDTIQFARYLPMIKERGGTVILECQPVLCQLLTGVLGADQIIALGSPLPSFDVHMPLLSLPGLFGTTLATIPARIPYISRTTYHAPRTLDKAVAFGSPLNVGIAWQANPQHKGFRHKSFSLSLFETIARVDGVRLHSLQFGPGSEQIATAPFAVTDLGSRFAPDSLADLAAALKSMDLVITVDTAAAHLAGALGVPVWVPLPLVPDWRWLLDRLDCPWYPTMRLFRQTKLGDWREVFERIAREVRLNYSDI